MVYLGLWTGRRLYILGSRLLLSAECRGLWSRVVQTSPPHGGLLTGGGQKRRKRWEWSVLIRGLTVTLGRTVERREVESSVCVCAHSSGVGSLVSSICFVVISTIKGQTEEQVVPQEHAEPAEIT